MLIDLRVTTLEENIGNSSVADLEVRVDAIEGTAADHETRLSSTEDDVTGKFLQNIFDKFFES